MALPLMRHLHTVLKTASPLGRYQWPAPLSNLQGDVILM